MGYYLGLQSTMLRDVNHTLNLCLAKDRVNASRVNVRKFTRSDRGQSARIHAASTENQSLKLFSPAKINVFLRVVRRREDGYHDLASLFHVIDLGDDMEFSLLPSGSSADALQCNMPDVPTDSSNLVIKALDLFRRKTGASERWSVNLLKRVPAGAGMGGGSGNAATALWAANEMCGRPATTEQLLEWAGDIGSDISVFFSRGAAYCTGRYDLFSKSVVLQMLLLSSYTILFKLICAGVKSLKILTPRCPWTPHSSWSSHL